MKDSLVLKDLLVKHYVEISSLTLKPLSVCRSCDEWILMNERATEFLSMLMEVYFLGRLDDCWPTSSLCKCFSLCRSDIHMNLNSPARPLGITNISSLFELYDFFTSYERNLEMNAEANLRGVLTYDAKTQCQLAETQRKTENKVCFFIFYIYFLHFVWYKWKLLGYRSLYYIVSE